MLIFSKAAQEQVIEYNNIFFIQAIVHFCTKKKKKKKTCLSPYLGSMLERRHMEHVASVADTHRLGLAEPRKGDRVRRTSGAENLEQKGKR